MHSQLQIYAEPACKQKRHINLYRIFVYIMVNFLEFTCIISCIIFIILHRVLKAEEIRDEIWHRFE